MNVNKKFDRFKQWGRERMGGEIATTTSDDFKALEMEMDLRHQGMERLQQSTSAYVKSLSRRDQGEGKEKQLAVGYFGSTLTSHGDDFEPDSEFGQCLLGLGRANERIARMQETYCANATSSWLESVERSLVQMKEYQAARKKLESRRLAFDAASAKMQKSKKEDYKMEEELRSQKAKYEESNEEVVRRMLDIKEAEQDSVADLTSFLDAELAYYERSREVLLQLRKEWPAAPVPSNRSDTGSPVPSLSRTYTNNTTRTRSRASSITDRFARMRAGDDPAIDPLDPPARIGSFSSRLPSGQNSPRRELPGFDLPSRPALSRNASGFEGPTTLGATRELDEPDLISNKPRLSRLPTDPLQLQGVRSGLRVGKRDSQYPGPGYGGGSGGGDVFADDRSDGADSTSFEALDAARRPSWSTTAAQDGSSAGGTVGQRKAPPPPPPPSRAKKPPPPPPMKRSALSTSEVPRY